MASSVTIDGLEFTRYVQASFKIKGGGLVVWVDPHRVGENEVGDDKADLVLVTHPHGEHMDPAALTACAKQETVLITNPVVWSQLQGRLGDRFADVATIRAGESTERRGVPVQAVAGYNQHHPKDQGFNTAFVFTVGGKRIFHGGDTDAVPEFGGLGAVDIALYPIGGTYTSDEADAATAIRDLIKPRVAIPMHYGYATGGDPNRFKELVGDAAKVHILDPVLNVRYGQ